ncbi:MAG: Crp/Fnr family transcriptional regulator [Hydrogenophaga sp.]|nr:Crp/Fnr family transcriptional regulator [Hydrogenophaga sp.]
MPPSENRLIQQLSTAVRKQFLDRCEPFELVLSAELSENNTVLSHAYFPREGYISLVIELNGHPSLEVGMVGREAMLGSELILGLAKTPWRALVQGAGMSWRIGAEALREASDALPELRDIVQRTLMVRLHQAALAAACERFHMIGPRLARWLLMSQDRAHSPSFHVTQEFMALMLGVRRVGVTQAAGEFQHGGLIEYHRGELTVLDRAGLEAEACSCYESDRGLYTELMGHKA